MHDEFTTKNLFGPLIGALAGTLLGGCSTAPINTWLMAKGQTNAMKEVMERNDKIVPLSSLAMERGKPLLLLLHGATDDPTEMLDIARDCRGQYTILLYSYNYHQPIEKVALGLVREMKTLKANLAPLAAEGRSVENVTVITFSYSAIVFRKAVLIADDKTLFSGASLIQLVPTAGGSFFARGMRNPVAASLVSMASKPSVAENPYGSFAEEIWEGEGNRRFYEVINPSRMQTILLEGDAHSVARIEDKEVQKRYHNGIGSNVVVIPKSLGVTHEYFPSHPVVLACLRKMLEL